GWGRREIDAAIATGQRTDIRLTHKIPVAWIYLTGWASRDGSIHFRDDIYGLDDKKPLMADAGRSLATAARANGFVLQSADPQPIKVNQVSYLDSQ
ncbi:MAG: murein L,D-transpeptidase, partial [Bradyrhizobium sp.]|nr:murein L,D-transpeptidase [Bradyrhizobium sp.]